MEKLVSVIIPTYGRCEKLDLAIDSVLKQTYKNIEIIIVDDNGINTFFGNSVANLMKKYVNNIKIRYIQHNVNKNGAAARNTGILNSHGYYISFLDDDDCFYANKIKEQVSTLEKNNCECVTCDRIQNNTIIRNDISGDLIKKILLLEFMPITSSLLFTAKSIKDIKGFNEKYKRHQDLELMIRYLKKYKIINTNKVLVNVGTNDGENDIHGHQLEQMKKNFLNTFNNEIEGENKKMIYSIHYTSIFVDHLKEKHYLLAIKIYIYSMFHLGWQFYKAIFKLIKRRKAIIKLRKNNAKIN